MRKRRSLFSLLSVIGGVGLVIKISRQALLGGLYLAHLHIVVSPCDGVAQPSNVQRLLDEVLRSRAMSSACSRI